MNPDIPALAQARRGVTSNGVPFIALPPEAAPNAMGLVVAWHGADPPRTEEALAAAVPMCEVPAWRIYLGMPLYGKRQPAGGFDEIMRLSAQDALKLIFQPSIGGAVGELVGAVHDLRAQLGIASDLPLGIFGFSQGGAAALLALSRHLLPFKAVATFGAVVDLRALVDALAGFFGISYEWTEERRGLAEELSSVHRARALAESDAAILLGVGAEDPYPVRGPTERLAGAIEAAGGTAEARIVQNVGHAFVDEPGAIAAPQGPQARVVDQLASEWFTSNLR